MLKESEVTRENIDEFLTQHLAEKSERFRKFFRLRFNCTVLDRPLYAAEWVMRLLNGNVEDYADSKMMVQLEELELV